jgi:hypothetical protein
MEGCVVRVVASGVVAARVAIQLLVLLVVATFVVLARLGSFDPYDAVGAVNPAVAALSPDELKAAAADTLEAATNKGGSGYAFDIVQTSTITARPGGPLIDVPSPTNAYVIIGQADTYPLNTLLERGIVTDAGFSSEIRAWPVGGGAPQFEKAELRRSALSRDGVGWRNDREGWYQAEVLPGIGLDPATAALLPTLLREASGAEKRADELVDGSTHLRVDATAQKADIPGVVAADGLSYTELKAPIEFSFDGQGRLVGIHVIALNTNLKDFDLVVDTVITIRYHDIGGLPAPDPTFVAGKTEESGR